MKKTASLIIGLLFIFCTMTSLRAEDIVHVVKKGDTLWDITKHYAANPWKWPIVWANNDDITNPHLIFPGDQVIISRSGGKTTITIIPAGKAGAQPAVFTTSQIAAVKDKSIVVSQQYSTYFYSPNELTGSGSVVGKVDIGELAARNESVLIKSKSGLAKGKGITIVSKVSDVTNKDAVVGYLYKAVAIAQVSDSSGAVYKADVAYSNQEIKPGDVIFDDLKPIQPLKLTMFEPAIKDPGRVIDLYGGVSGSSYLDLVFVNLGKNDGVDKGALLSLYSETKVEEENTSLREYAGMCLVLQSLDTSCIALVTESKVPIKRDFVADGVK